MTGVFNGPERRKYRRYKVKLTVLFHKDASVEARLRAGEKESEATMIDLSEGGLSILTGTDVSEGTTIWVKFSLTRVENECVNFYGSIELRGEVRNKVQIGHGYRLGISFQKVDERNRREIVDFLNLVESCITPKRPDQQ
jgi:c-di-GMP-binding flagellar brake protein YcgR